MAASRRLTVGFIEIPLHRTSPYFRTKPASRRLAAAVAASLALHLLPALPGLIAPAQLPSPPLPQPPLQAELRPPAPPPLQLPQPAAPEPPPSAKKRPLPPPPPTQPGKAAPATWTQAVKQHLQKLQKSGQFYPAEAIAAGLQGDVEVLFVLDEAGKVVAARVEHSSGHAILDEAALRAVRSLSSVPADAPRQAVLPVRFRLH